MKSLSAILLTVALSMSVAFADSGFMEDYSILQSRDLDGGIVDRVYTAPGIMQKLQSYNAVVMVDQPEIFLSPESKYKGAKPDQLKALADTMRLAMMERLEAGGYTTTDEAGPGVIYLRWAVTDLFLKKKKRGFLSYTPIGLVVHATAQAAVRDLWKKIDIVELGIEFELLDSESGELLAAAVASRGQRKTDGQDREIVSWEELDASMRTFGERVRCQLDNAKISADQREDCTQIVIEPEVDVAAP